MSEEEKKKNDDFGRTGKGFVAKLREKNGDNSRKSGKPLGSLAGSIVADAALGDAKQRLLEDGKKRLIDDIEDSVRRDIEAQRESTPRSPLSDPLIIDAIKTGARKADEHFKKPYSEQQRLANEALTEMAARQKENPTGKERK